MVIHWFWIISLGNLSWSRRNKMGYNLYLWLQLQFTIPLMKT